MSFASISGRIMKAKLIKTSTVILIMIIGTRLSTVSSLKVPMGTTSPVDSLRCLKPHFWTVKVSRNKNVFRCKEASSQFLAFMNSNTTLSQEDLAAVYSLWLWSNRFLRSHDSTVFREMEVSGSGMDEFYRPGFEVFTRDLSDAADLDQFHEDQFLHHSQRDRLFNPVFPDLFLVFKADGNIFKAKARDVLGKWIQYNP